MATNDDEHKELFDRVNALETGQAETNGYLKAVVEQNERYIKLVWRVILILATISFLSLLAVIYGAIGEKGLHSVRETMPRYPSSAFIKEAIPVLYDEWGLC